MSDDKGAAENTDKVVHVFKREDAGMFAPQDVVSITAQGGLTICIAGLCITKRPEDWHAMAASEVPPMEPLVRSDLGALRENGKLTNKIMVGGEGIEPPTSSV